MIGSSNLTKDFDTSKIQKKRGGKEKDEDETAVY
jgi:hypothetical protein